MKSFNRCACCGQCGVANDDSFLREERPHQFSVPMWSAHKIAVSLPYLPAEQKGQTIREIIRLLKVGLGGGGEA